MDPPELPIRHTTPSLTFLNSLALYASCSMSPLILDPEKEKLLRMSTTARASSTITTSPSKASRRISSHRRGYRWWSQFRPCTRTYWLSPIWARAPVTSLSPLKKPRTMLQPTKEATIEHTVFILEKKLFTMPNISQGIMKSHSPSKKPRKDASFTPGSLLKIKEVEPPAGSCLNHDWITRGRYLRHICMAPRPSNDWWPARP